MPCKGWNNLKWEQNVIVAYANGGPRSRVCSRKNPKSSPFWPPKNVDPEKLLTLQMFDPQECWPPKNVDPHKKVDPSKMLSRSKGIREKK
jgi:hypothetical protein